VAKNAHDHARVGFAAVSIPIPSQTVYIHLGWRKHERRWIYLHSQGALGADAPVDGIEVAPAEGCRLYVLPPPPKGDDLIAAVRASLRLREVGPTKITVPMQASIPRAVVGSSAFTLYYSGGTGNLKSSFTACGQGHFGAGFDYTNLPGNWQSTGNSLKALGVARRRPVAHSKTARLPRQMKGELYRQ
jgi:hypothetical protein